MQLLAIALGGALGALARYLVSSGIHAVLGRGFPYGTLVVNVLGSLLMGFLLVQFTERLGMPPQARALWLVGFLGGFTTFSTFSVETLGLLEEGELLRAGANVALNLVLCLLAAWAGLLLGRQL
jgi:CrcB protein